MNWRGIAGRQKNYYCLKRDHRRGDLRPLEWTLHDQSYVEELFVTNDGKEKGCLLSVMS